MKETPTYNDSVELFRIARAVSYLFTVSLKELRAKTRKREVVIARQYYFYICRERTTISFGKIGGYLKRDHATALYGHNKIKDQATIYPDVQENADQIFNLLVLVRNENDKLASALRSLENAYRLYEQFLKL